MSTDAGTGASTDGSQAGTDTTSTMTDRAGAAGTGTGTTTTTSTDDWDADDWKAFAKEVGLSPAKVKERLGHARTWEQRARENKTGADQAATLQQQVEEMRQQQAERNERDIKRAENLAVSHVRSGLAEAGIKADDVKDLLAEIDPRRLLKDGDPDDKAVARIVRALTRAAGRPTPDHDQGQGGTGAPTSMAGFMQQLRNSR